MLILVRRCSPLWRHGSDYLSTAEKLVAAVAAFPNLVLLALAHSVKYLSNFNVEDALRETKFFAKFAERTHMLLNGNTLTNLSVLSYRM